MPTQDTQLKNFAQLDRHRFGGYFYPMFEADTVCCSVGDYADIQEVIKAEFRRRYQAARETARMNHNQTGYNNAELRGVMTDLSANVNDFPVLFKIDNQIFTPEVDEDLPRGELALPEDVGNPPKVFVEIPRPTQANIRHLAIPSS